MFRVLFVAAALAVGAIGLAPVATADQPFKNCTQARDAGYEDIPATSEYYGEHLDSDLDGIGCES
jgi:hypothetical protein